MWWAFLFHLVIASFNRKELQFNKNGSFIVAEDLNVESRE